MNNREIAKNNMYKKVKTFVDAQQKVDFFKGYTRLLTELDVYSTLNKQLDDYIKKQNRVITGVTTDKNAALADVAVIAVKASRKLLVYAKDENNADLAALFDVRVDDITKAAYATGVSIVENILEAIQGIATPLTDYRVSAADVQAIADGIAACEGEQGEPGDAIAQRVAATAGIKTVMKKIDDCLKLMDDMIVSEYEADFEDVVNQYRSDRRIDNTGLHHSGINAIVSVGDAFAEDVLMQIEALDKKAVSDINGIAEISPMTPGTYHVSFSGKGYEPLVLTLTIEKGKILAVSVEMKAAV